MKIAVASGKGGTGKTTISTNLAYLAARAGRSVAYADCDVEEPNGHLFLTPTITGESSINRLLPVVDPQRCVQCGRCAEACRFGAIACVGRSVLVFPELCHSCGGCQLACCEAAISEMPRTIGRVRWGSSGPVRFVDGLLNVGEAMSPPAIRAVKDAVPHDAELVFLDCPPGTSCPTIESVRGADFVLLVVEPTISGLHDLRRVGELAEQLRVPGMLVVNKADLNPEWTDRMEQWAERRRLPIAGRIPYDVAVTAAQVAMQTVVEAGEGPAAHAIRAVWNIVVDKLRTTAELPVRDVLSCAG